MEELLADDLTTVDFENVLRGTVLLGDAHVLREVGAGSRRHSGAHHQVTIDANLDASIIDGWMKKSIAERPSAVV
jgi:hypothetical protein